MVWTYFCLEDRYAFPLAQLSQYRTYFQSPISIERFSSVLWGKYNMVLTIPLRV